MDSRRICCFVMDMSKKPQIHIPANRRSFVSTKPSRSRTSSQPGHCPKQQTHVFCGVSGGRLDLALETLQDWRCPSKLQHLNTSAVCNKRRGDAKVYKETSNIFRARCAADACCGIACDLVPRRYSTCRRPSHQSKYM